MASSRSKRSTAGNRMERFLDDNLEEEDMQDEFWADGGVLAEKFKVEGEDEEFAEDLDDEDSADSDFDDPEDEPEQEVVEPIPEKKKKKKNVYIDPKKKASTKKAPTQPKRPVQIVNTVSNMSLRHTTIAHTEERKLQRQNELKAKVRRKPRKKKVRKSISQAQRLAAAKLTKKANTEALERMLRLEEDKKKPAFKRYKIEGPKISMFSKPDGIVIAFQASSDVPLYNPPIIKRPLKCAVTGKRARFLDPKTGKGYSDIASFKEIRSRLDPKNRLPADKKPQLPEAWKTNPPRVRLYMPGEPIVMAPGAPIAMAAQPVAMDVEALK